MTNPLVVCSASQLASELHAEKIGNEYRAFCPIHERTGAHTPSLSFRDGDTQIIFTCLSQGCDSGEIARALLNGKGRSLIPTDGQKIRLADERFRACLQREADTVYDYRDGGGTVLKGRWNLTEGGKVFAWWSVRDGKRVWGKPRNFDPFYRYFDVVRSEKNVPVWIVEGEKDCDSLHALGILATSAPDGAKSWDSGLARQLFEGRTVIICPDNDDAGEQYLETVRVSMPATASVRVLRVPPPHKDMSDYLQTGGLLSDLINQAEDQTFPEDGIGPPPHICERCKRSLEAAANFSGEEYVIQSREGDGEGWFSFGAINVIAGSSGSGKSYWLDEMLEAVRNGRDFCGHRTTRSEYLVLLRDRSLKDAGTTWKKQLGISGRFREMAGNHPAEWEVFTRCFQELSTAEKRAPVAEIIDKYARLHPDVRVISVEGLDLWVPSKMMDPDKTEAALQELQTVAQRHRIALIGTLGSPKVKGIDAYVGRDNLYGSTITGRMSDTVVVVNKKTRDDELSVRVLDVLLRHTKREKFYFNWNDEGRLVPVPEPVATESRLAETDTHKRLREIAQKHFKPGEPVIYSKLGASWGYSENTFNTWRQSAAGSFLIGKKTPKGTAYYLNAEYLPGCEPAPDGGES